MSASVVVTDLDGTLWRGAGSIHPETLAAWHHLVGMGVPVIVATGRRRSSAQSTLARAGLAPPAVHLNGALVMDLGNDEVYDRQCFGAEDAAFVLDAFHSCGVSPCVYVEHPRLEAVHGPDPTICSQHLEGFGLLVAPGDLGSVVARLPVQQFAVLGREHDLLREVVPMLDGRAEVRFAPDGVYGGHSLTVTPAGLSKWVGVVSYCDRRGLRSDEILAAGDGPNDRELLARAAIVVAPEDAHPDLLRVADHVVPSARVGGWAQILHLVGR